MEGVRGPGGAGALLRPLGRRRSGGASLGVDFVSALAAQGCVRRRVRTGRPLAAFSDTDLPLNRRYFLM